MTGRHDRLAARRGTQFQLELRTSRGAGQIQTHTAQRNVLALAIDGFAGGVVFQQEPGAQPDAATTRAPGCAVPDRLPAANAGCPAKADRLRGPVSHPVFFSCRGSGCGQKAPATPRWPDAAGSSEPPQAVLVLPPTSVSRTRQEREPESSCCYLFRGRPGRSIDDETSRNQRGHFAVASVPGSGPEAHPWCSGRQPSVSVSVTGSDPFASTINSATMALAPARPSFPRPGSLSGRTRACQRGQQLRAGGEALDRIDVERSRQHGAITRRQRLQIGQSRTPTPPGCRARQHLLEDDGQAVGIASGADLLIEQLRRGVASL